MPSKGATVRVTGLPVPPTVRTADRACDTSTAYAAEHLMEVSRGPLRCRVRGREGVLVLVLVAGAGHGVVG